MCEDLILGTTAFFVAKGDAPIKPRVRERSERNPRFGEEVRVAEGDEQSIPTISFINLNLIFRTQESKFVLIGSRSMMPFLVADILGDCRNLRLAD